jgi:hypothetical protein
MQSLQSTARRGECHAPTHKHLVCVRRSLECFCITSAAPGSSEHLHASSHSCNTLWRFVVPLAHTALSLSLSPSLPLSLSLYIAVHLYLRNASDTVTQGQSQQRTNTMPALECSRRSAALWNRASHGSDGARKNLNGNSRASINIAV